MEKQKMGPYQYPLILTFVSIAVLRASADDHSLEEKQQVAVGPYQTAAFHVGWTPKLNVVKDESKLVERLGVQTLNLLKEATRLATEREVAERDALGERLRATTSAEGKLQQLNQYLLKSQERGAEYRESVDELVSPTDIEFVMRLGAGEFDVYDAWFLASIGGNKALIDRVNETALMRAKDWVSLVKSQQARTPAPAEFELEDARLLTKHRLNVLKLFTKEQQHKAMEVTFGLQPQHSKKDLNDLLEKRTPMFDSNDKAKKKLLDEIRESLMSAIKYD